MRFSCFPVLPGSAEAQVIWGGIVKSLLIVYFIGNISAKKYQNAFTYVKVNANQRSDVFLRRSVHIILMCLVFRATQVVAVIGCNSLTQKGGFCLVGSLHPVPYCSWRHVLHIVVFSKTGYFINRISRYLTLFSSVLHIA